jgi:hypothetical protein
MREQDLLDFDRLYKKLNAQLERFDDYFKKVSESSDFEILQERLK